MHLPKLVHPKVNWLPHPHGHFLKDFGNLCLSILYFSLSLGSGTRCAKTCVARRASSTAFEQGFFIISNRFCWFSTDPVNIKQLFHQLQKWRFTKDDDSPKTLVTLVCVCVVCGGGCMWTGTCLCNITNRYKIYQNIILFIF